MKELGDARCEVRKIVELQVSNWEYQNGKNDDDPRSVPGSPGTSQFTHFMGGFLDDVNYAWLSCGSKLIVVNAKTGVSISTWTFRERISCLTQFPTQPGQIPLLLIGLDNDANRIKDSSGMICIFDCTISQVLRAIRMPAGVEQLCIINGGAEWEEINDNEVNDILIESHGMACVALKNLDHYIVDLRRNSWENMVNLPFMDEANPAEIDIPESSKSSSRHRTNKERHSVHNLMNERIERYIGFNRNKFESSALFQEKMTTSMISSRKIGCLVSGCLGRIIIWQNDGTVKWISPSFDNMAVSHLALLEPTDDPRPFCYLWVAYQEEAPSKIPPILRMYAMLFERKYSDKGMNLYFKLEGEPSLKFELEMERKNRITSLYPIVRGNNQEQTESGNKKGEDSLLLINIEGKSILFDLNQWYKEQMPRFIGDCQNPDAILSSYQSDSELTVSDTVISCAYIPSTLKEFSCTSSTTPEELFFPNSLSLEWVELGIKCLTYWMTRGVQTQLLREMAMAGPIIMIQPSETFHRCISTGLIPFNPEISFNTTADSQRDALLTLCLEQRWTVFLLKCAKEWSDGSAAYLYPAFLHWVVQRASTIQLTAHQLCIPLFDQSGSSIGEAEVRTLRFYSQQMECLCNIIENLSIETDDSEKQRRTLRRISTYLQILLWFYDVGLLPETQDIDDESLPISFILKIPYPAEKLSSIYAEKRKQYRRNDTKNKDDEAVMFIDELISRECPALISQWEQESNEINHGGHYPPPSLQSLLRSCLIDCYHFNTNEMENKHQIIIYLLMDLVMLLQSSCPGVDQLIKYPSAFKLSPSLIKLTQALWFLDHEDYQGFLDIMTGQLVSEADIKDWHHKLVMRTLLRSNQNKLALIYIRVRKPPLSSIDDQGTVIHLSVEHGLVQSAFHHRPQSHYRQLLIKFFRACKAHGKLNDILHLALDNNEEEAFIQFLDEEKCEETRLVYYLQHSQYNEANNTLTVDQNIGSKKGNKPASLSMFHAYNATLPAITRRFSTNIRRNMEIDVDSRYPRPMSHYKNRVSARDIYETVIKKAKETFIRNDRSQIPFISAPCSSLKTVVSTNESNCVLFVERVRKPCMKRTLQEMKDEDVMSDNELEVKKRRKNIESNDKIDVANTRDVDLNMTFGTPLVKKKHQVNLTKDGPLETPHSILKIRQLIRDSTSPPGKVSSSEDEKLLDTEKKPRQIRFSINQPKIDSSQIEETSNNNNELIGDEDEHLDTTESVKSLSVTPSNHSGDEDDEYYSPNDNIKSLYESSVLTDSSSYHSKSLSGPRPRPGLRRNIIDSPYDGMRKSLIRCSTMNAESLQNSVNTPPDFSLTSEIASSTFINPCTSRVSQNQLALPSTSIYASSVLSSNTSAEFSPGNLSCEIEKRALCTSNSVRKTPMKSSVQHDSLLEVKDNREEMNFVDNSTNFICSNITNTQTVNVEMNKSVDRFSDTKINDSNESKGHMKCPVLNDSLFEVTEKNDETESVLPSKVIIKHDEFSNKHGIDDIQHTDAISYNPRKLTDNSENVICAMVDKTSNRASLDDYDDELLALKYDDDGEDDDDDDEDDKDDDNNDQDDHDNMFKSFSDSMEEDNIQVKRLSDKIPVQIDLPEKTTKHLYDEFNITDDESSKSLDRGETADIINSQNTQSNYALSESPITVHPMCDDANITDDKTDDSLDSFRCSTSCATDKNMNERSEITTIRETSSNSNIETMLENERKHSIELQIAETKEQLIVEKQTPDSLEKPMNKIIPDEQEETSVPIKIRTRRASSVVPIMHESNTETPDIRTTGRRQRATSLAKELQSTPKLTSHIESLESDNRIESPAIKKVGARQSTSLMKEVLTTSMHIEPKFEGIIESPIRRSSRRVASIQKDVSEMMQNTSKKLELPSNSSVIEVNTMDVSEPLRKMTRSKRATSVQKDITEIVNTSEENTELITSSIDQSEPVKKITSKKETFINEDTDNKIRKTRATSVSEKVDDSTVKNLKSKRSQSTSVSAQKDEQIIKENPTSSVRKTRARSVSKETDNSIVKNPKAKRTRTTSVAAENNEQVIQENTMSTRKTRGTSISKESTDKLAPKEPKFKRTRTASITEDINEEVNTEDVPLARRTRAASVSKDNTENTVELMPRRRRAASLASDVPNELPPRRTRATSLTKEIIEDNSPMPRRSTRASSLTKETSGQKETTNKRVTRRNKATSIAEDVIPEEDVDELIFTSKRAQTGIARVVEDTFENHSNLPQSRSSSIVSTQKGKGRDEDKEEEDVEKNPSSDVSKKKEKKGSKDSNRHRRATSVDIPEIGKKRRTRGLAKSMSIDDHNRDEESSEVDEKNTLTRKITRRMKRAMSETTELVERSKSGSKLTQIDESDDPNDLEPPEATRNAGDKESDGGDVPEYIFSPPGSKFVPTFSNQPRRPIANFISPLTDEEQKMALEGSTGKSIKSNNSKQTRKTSSMLGFRTKFVIRPQNNSK